VAGCGRLGEGGPRGADRAWSVERGGSAGSGALPVERGGPAGSGRSGTTVRRARGERAAAAGSELLLARAAGSGFLLARNRRIWEGWMPPPAGSGREGGAARERERECGEGVFASAVGER